MAVMASETLPSTRLPRKRPNSQAATLRLVKAITGRTIKPTFRILRLTKIADKIVKRGPAYKET